MREGQCHYTGTGNSRRSPNPAPGVFRKGKKPGGRRTGTQGKRHGRGKEGEAGGADDKESTQSPVFILRTTGSWKPETGRSGLSGCGGKVQEEAGPSARRTWQGSEQGEGALGQDTEQGWISAPSHCSPWAGALG